MTAPRKANLLRIAGSAVGVLSVLFGAVGPVRGNWVDGGRYGPLVCRAEFPLVEIEPLLSQLPEIQTSLMEQLKIPPTREPIELYLFRGKTTYDQHLARNLPNIAYRRALYVKDKGPGRVYAYRGPHFDVDLRHEVTHALLHGALPVVPLWLDEGLALYFEPPPEKRIFDSPQWDSVRWSVWLGGLRSLSGLENKRRIEDMNRLDYRSSWAWVHFMLHGPPEAREELVKYLGDIQAGRPGVLLSYRLRLRLGDPEEQLVSHVRNWSRR
jgi:hypothetical protein